MAETGDLSGVSLTGKAIVENNKLAVEYTVSSSLSHTIYVLDEMIEYDKDAQPKLNRETAYRFWEEPATLRLVRAVLRIPPNMNVYSLEMPYAREVKPQGSITGKILLDLPVNEESPFYPPPPDDNSEVAKCRRIRLYLGWTEAREGVQITEANVGGEKVLRIRGNYRQHLVKADFAATVDVVAHTDAFDRQLPQKWEE